MTITPRAGTSRAHGHGVVGVPPLPHEEDVQGLPFGGEVVGDIFCGGVTVQFFYGKIGTAPFARLPVTDKRRRPNAQHRHASGGAVQFHRRQSEHAAGIRGR
jgi:hypothetical protein